MKSYSLLFIYFSLFGISSAEPVICQIEYGDHSYCITNTGVGQRDALNRQKSWADADLIKLKKWIYQRAIEREAQKRNIVITDEEVRAYLDQYYPDPDNALSTLTKLHTVLPVAWRQAKSNMEEEREIYETTLKGLLSYQQWRSFLDRESGADTIERMEKMNTPTQEDLYRVHPGFKKALLEKRVVEAVYQEIQYDEAALYKMYESSVFNAPFEQVRDVVEDLLVLKLRRERWKQWVSDNMMFPALVIHDEALRRAYENFLKMPPQEVLEAERTN